MLELLNFVIAGVDLLEYRNSYVVAINDRALPRYEALPGRARRPSRTSPSSRKLRDLG
eukprot:SAG11_NODE_34662_length_270_cov_2.362573_1_plen_57_part_01